MYHHPLNTALQCVFRSSNIPSYHVTPLKAARNPGVLSCTLEGVGLGSISGLPHKQGRGSVPAMQSLYKAPDIPLGLIPGMSGPQEGMFLQLWVHTVLTPEVGP